MVHRPADSRLLANLLHHEKDYSKHLHALLDPAHASLSAFSAYASASAPPVSNGLLAVATSLSGADEALARYAGAVDECMERLKYIKILEDEVANIVRDREILVNRLIKASKSNKPKFSQGNNRDSLHLLQQHPQLQSHGSSSSLSLSSVSVFSGSPSFSHSLSPGLPTSAKLSAAQAELQACEAHLATKERELAVGRTNALREGLSLRCRALVECGWVWGEMGKEALRVLDGLAGNDFLSFEWFRANHWWLDPTVNGDASRGPSPGPSPPQNRISLVHYDDRKPLPEPQGQHKHTSSDLSLSPSQSASQISTHFDQPQYRRQAQQQPMYIPPAHAISDNDHFPSSGATRHVLARRITEEELQRHQQLEEEEGGSSDDELQAQEVQVIENPRFAPAAPSPLRKQSSKVNQTQNHSRASFIGDAPPPPPSSTTSTSPSKPGLLGKKFSVRHPPAQTYQERAAAAPPETVAYGKKGSPRGRAASVDGGPEHKPSFFGSLRGMFGHHPSPSMSQLPGPSSSNTTSAMSAAFYEPLHATPEKEKRRSGGFFGGGKEKGKEKDDSDSESRARWGRKAREGRKWETRTDRNLKNVQRESTKGTVRADEHDVPYVPRSPIRESVNGRGRVVSDAGLAFGPNSGNFADIIARPSISDAGPSVTGVSPSTSIATAGPGRKLKKSVTKGKGRPRSSSVPPITPSVDADEKIGRPEVTREASTPPGPGTTKEVGVKEGLTVTVLERAASPRLGASPPPSTNHPNGTATNSTNTAPRRPNGTMSASDTEATAGGASMQGRKSSAAHVRKASVAAPSAPGVQRNSSVRSSASAPPTSPWRKTRASAGYGQGKSVLETGKQMPSLLRVVEDADRNLATRSGSGTNSANGYTYAALSAGGSARPIALMMQDIKAPRPVGRKEVEAFTGAEMRRGRNAERGAPGLSIPQAPGSVFDVPTLGGGSSSSLAVGQQQGERRPAKSPLRSALRNPSRTPSPLPPPNLQIHPEKPPSVARSPPQAQQHIQTSLQAPAPIHPPSQVPLLNGVMKAEDGDSDDADGASIESFETTNETFSDANSTVHGHNEEDDVHTRSQLSVPAPDTSAASGFGLTANGITSHDESQPPRVPQKEPVHPPEEPRRRKSVRVSLQPTFSPTPPAIDYDEGEEDPWAEQGWAEGSLGSKGDEAPTWGAARGKGKGKAGETLDMWEDSSDEDVEYARARRLLSRLGGRKKGAGAAAT
ncbi:hypothetical protein DXG03_000900 [Asterophora parasitica]|uniref:Uncharacterized protein n=1 Tax=Asterophora parasitica TaxID=117018 RepID=A0A9P7KAK6_9AGAR|nr:hypothetical protein DXG03_000900 [Asterophora parasitica]